MAVEDSAAQTQSMLEKILKRLDDQAVLSEKRHKDQSTFNAQVSLELQNVRKQLDLTQADVDEARRVTTPLQPPTVAPTAALQATLGGMSSSAPAVRLANEGPPLIPVVPTSGVQFSPVPPRPHLVRQNAEPRQRVEFAEDGGYVKPPKHDFPRFEGSLPNLWLDRCVAYFELYRVTSHNWVTTASLYMEGHAALWLQAFRQQHPQIPWDFFKQSVVEEFGPDEFEAQMHKLLQLRQTSTVTDYRKQFEVYMYHLLSLDPSLSTKFFVTRFLLGLKDELRAAVRIQAPTSIT